MSKILNKRQFGSVTIQLPASKSISNRALIINALSGAGVMPQNVSDCDDTFVMVRALTQPSEVIDIMAAGTAMRFLTAYLSVTEGERIITGTERMQHRPIAILVDALRQLGADIEYVNEEGFPPLRIKGKRLEGGHISLAGNVSSQYISAMLMIGPTLQKGLTLTLTGGIVSRPYIDMTLGIMREFGAKASFVDDTITVEPTGYTAIPYYIENDWSASSYWFEMVALTPGSEIRLPGLFAESLQGDQGVKDIFEKLGVTAEIQTPQPPKGGDLVDKGARDLVDKEVCDLVDKGARDLVDKEVRSLVDKEVCGLVDKEVCGLVDKEVRSLVDKEVCGLVDKESRDLVDKEVCGLVDKESSVSISLPGGEGQGEVALLRHTGKVVDRLDIDMLRVPDLAQTVVVTCAMLNVPFRITGLQSLKIKETDRITALRTELKKLGYLINEADDSMLYWDGERCEPQANASIDTYEDHRMAMSFAPCCQTLGSITINHPEVVSKSYPKFWEDFASIDN